MHHAALSEVFRAARDYHRSLADFARAHRGAGDLEHAAQQVIGASLRYRMTLDRLIDADPLAGAPLLATRPRLEWLRVSLRCASRSYNAIMK